MAPDAGSGSSDAQAGGPGPVLLGYDGSTAANRAVRTAATLFADREAIVVTVWEPLQTLSAGSAVSPVISTMPEADQTSHAESLAEQGLNLAREAGFAAVSAWPEGKTERVWSTILAVADEVGASLIVVGGRGRSALKSVLLGSVSQALSQHTDRPLLIVPDAPHSE